MTGRDKLIEMRGKLDEIIKELKRCAVQNEADDAKAVAAEQRRMLRILKALLK